MIVIWVNRTICFDDVIMSLSYPRTIKKASPIYYKNYLDLSYNDDDDINIIYSIYNINNQYSKQTSDTRSK